MDFINSKWPAKIEKQCKSYLRRRNELYLQLGNRVVTLFQLCERVINKLHDCHPGIVRKMALARSYCWWPSLDEMMETCVKKCKAC